MPSRVVVRVIESLWGILIAYWVLSAFGNKGTKVRQSRRSRLAYVAGLAAAWYWVASRRGLDVLVLPWGVPMQWAGVVVCAAGAGVAIRARRILGRNWSGFVMIKQDHELIQRGPYRFVRHPIYTGIILEVVS